MREVIPRCNRGGRSGEYWLYRYSPCLRYVMNPRERPKKIGCRFLSLENNVYFCREYVCAVGSLEGDFWPPRQGAIAWILLFVKEGKLQITRLLTT